jgi:hypothetical protein
MTTPSIRKVIRRPWLILLLLLAPDPTSAQEQGSTAVLGGPAKRDPKDQIVLSKMDQPIKLHFPDGGTLGQVIAEVSRAPGFESFSIQIDPKIAKDTRTLGKKVVLDVDGVPLKSALSLLARKLKLVYEVKDGKLLLSHDPHKEPPPDLLDVAMKAQDTTVYAPGYSEEKFRSIKLGATEAEVTRLIGEPFRVTRARPQIDWYYGPPTLIVGDDGGLSDSSGTFDTGTGYTVVTARLDGRIMNVHGGYFPSIEKDMIGKSLAVMKKRHGEPLEIRTNPASRFLIYSRTEVSGSYYTRAVGLDDAGKVVSFIAGYYFD